MSDPLTIVHDGLWHVLETWPGFTDLVPPGNRVKYSGEDRGQAKDRILTADVPEVRLVPVGLGVGWHETNAEHRVTQRYQLQARTGDLRLDRALYPVVWESLRALAAGLDALLALGWEGAPFVENVRVTGGQEGLLTRGEARRIAGWQALLNFDVEMIFEVSRMTA